MLAVLQIIAIDIVLAGDNAVVIALAVRRLPRKERMTGIVIGSGVAVALRVALTFVTSQLLSLNYVKLGGGALILWIAVKLLLENESHDENRGEASSLWQAIWLITIADITMSLDNVLAVGGASKGSFGLILFGLGLSIPLVVFTSNLLSRLMDRYPLIVYVGAAILGKVGGDMVMTDPVVQSWLTPDQTMIHVVETLTAVLVIAIPLTIRRLRHNRRRQG